MYLYVYICMYVRRTFASIALEVCALPSIVLCERLRVAHFRDSRYMFPCFVQWDGFLAQPFGDCADFKCQSLCSTATHVHVACKNVECVFFPVAKPVLPLRDFFDHDHWSLWCRDCQSFASENGRKKQHLLPAHDKMSCARPMVRPLEYPSHTFSSHWFLFFGFRFNNSTQLRIISTPKVFCRPSVLK